jgi:predicted nucleic acid-binding protein
MPFAAELVGRLTSLASREARPRDIVERLIVVFDTNVFNGDVRADRSRLRAILDGAAAKGAFGVMVPEVVLLELDKQFRKRSKAVVKNVNKALGALAGELVQLGLEGPDEMVLDTADADGYRAKLEERLTRVGGAVLPVPVDLTAAVPWAVNRRKPFKETGEGFQDAAIWLTILALAAAREDEIAFVTSNTKDFGNGADPVGLADELRGDLTERGRPEEQVRLVARNRRIRRRGRPACRLGAREGTRARPGWRV